MIFNIQKFNNKKAFSLVEIGLVFFVITAVFFAVIPFSVSNVKQAKLIAEWKNYEKQVQYSFETLNEYKKNNSLDIKGSVDRLLSYMDAKPMSTEMIKDYKYKMMNGHIFQKMNFQNFDKFYVDVDKRYIGVQYENGVCKSAKIPCATVWVDVNGSKSPNIVGKDIFVYEIYPDKIEAFGSGMDFYSMQSDCSKTGTGMSCSKFYLVGGDLK